MGVLDLKIILGRFGSHFGYNISRMRKKLRLLSVGMILFIIVSFSLATVKNHLMPIACTIAEAKAKTIGNILVSESVAQYFSKNDVKSIKLYSMEKNDAGDISAIVLNPVNVNMAKSEIIKNIHSRLANIDSQEIGIPMGSLINNEFLAGRGPKIPLKLIASGLADVDFTNAFFSAGINQTKHIVYIEVKLLVHAILPGARKTATITSKIPLEETMIVGKVPNTYANVDLKGALGAGN
jgi:sporulation protein YunB